MNKIFEACNWLRILEHKTNNKALNRQTKKTEINKKLGANVISVYLKVLKVRKLTMHFCNKENKIFNDLTNERKLIKIKLTEVFRFVFGLKVNSFFFQVVNSMIFWMNTYYASLTKLLWVNDWILKVQLQNFILREKMFTLH